MFRKHINASNTRQLGGKDAKKFRADVAKHYPSLTEEQAAVLFPPKTGVTMAKMSNRSVVYGRDDGIPLFFDPNGHGDKLIPTVFALSFVPYLVPTLYTWSDVSSKVLGGADLFLQGVLQPTDGSKLEPFLAGSVRSISVPGNPLPFAVGTMAVSSTEAAREGFKGRGLTLMHCYGDLLWTLLGPKNYPPPNAGFTPGKILPIEINENSTGSNGGSAIGEAASNGLAPPSADGGGGDDVADATRANDQEEETTSLQETSIDKLAAMNLSGEEQAPSSMSTAIDIDPLLEAAVLGGLKSVTNAELPLQFGDFYQKHMLPLRPEGITFDFKASKKYKKLSKLLDVFEKEKVLVQKQIRKQDHISSVDRTHPLLVQWKGMPQVEGGASATTTTTSSTNGNPTAAPATASAIANIKKSVHVEYLYKPPTSLRPLFINAPSTCTTEKERLFSEKEVSAALASYATAQHLFMTTSAINPQPVAAKNNDNDLYIKLDNLLATSLWGKKEGPEEGSEISQSLLLQRLLSKLQQWHRILRPLSEQEINSNSSGSVSTSTVSFVEVVRKGPVRPLSLIAEKRRGRNVTAVAHVETFGWTANEIAADYQRRFKTACSVSKLPGKQESDYEILMQGDLCAKVEKYLKEVQGIDAKFLQVSNKLSGKKKG